MQSSKISMDIIDSLIDQIMINVPSNTNICYIKMLNHVQFGGREIDLGSRHFDLAAGQ